MTWTGIATDLTLTDVIGLSRDGTPAPTAAQSLGLLHPYPEGYTTADMPRRGPVRRFIVNTVGMLLLLLFALVFLSSNVPAVHRTLAGWLGNPDARAVAVLPLQAEVPAPVPAEKPAPRAQTKSLAKSPKKGTPAKAAHAPAGAVEQPAPNDAGDTGDMSLEKFRQLSGKT